MTLHAAADTIILYQGGAIYRHDIQKAVFIPTGFKSKKSKRPEYLDTVT